MTTPVNICQMALQMIGARTSISSINPSDGSAEANACSIFYTPVLQMLLRSAHWGAARKQVSGTQLKALFINGILQPTNLQPPTPWWYEYAVPSDSLKERFILNICPQGSVSPPLTTSSGQFQVPQNVMGFARFTPAVDLDSSGNSVKVILTNQYQAQIVYTADISQTPNLWDSMFLMGAATALASYLVNPLARNAALLKDMVSQASGAIAQARATDGNESFPTQDHIPDWIQTRMVGAGANGGGGWGGPGVMIGGYDSMSFPGGLFY